MAARPRECQESVPEKAGPPRSPGPHFIVGAATLALDGTDEAAAGRPHPHPLAGVGPENNGAADILYDGHDVRGRDRREARLPAAPGPPALGGATPVADRA